MRIQIFFTGFANDGISCESYFAVHVLLELLSGDRSYYAHTDTNYNTKSLFYQLMIGINIFKAFGIYIIDGILHM